VKLNQSPRAAPTNARSRRTRSALLAAALDLLQEGGFGPLTVGGVAERAGVSRRAVYLHFASRSALVGALFDYVAETGGLAASLRRVHDAPDAVSALDEWARHESTFHASVLGVMRALEHVGRADPDANIWRRRVADYQMLDCRRLAQRLADEHRLAPGWTVDTVADMLWALLPTELLERLLVDRGWSPARYAQLYARLLRSTFVAPG
jgi:AcrR family transcriptional regulator